MISVREELSILAAEANHGSLDQSDLRVLMERYAPMGVDLHEAVNAVTAYLTNRGRWPKPPNLHVAFSLAMRMYEVGYRAGQRNPTTTQEDAPT